MAAPSQAMPAIAANLAVSDVVRPHAAVNVREDHNKRRGARLCVAAGLSFADENSIRIALVSPAGGIRSSTLDMLGNVSTGTRTLAAATTARCRRQVLSPR